MVNDTLFREVDELMENREKSMRDIVAMVAELMESLAKSITEWENTPRATGNTSEAQHVFLETLALCKKFNKNFADADMNYKLVIAYNDRNCADTNQQPNARRWNRQTTVRSRGPGTCAAKRSTWPSQTRKYIFFK